MSKKCSSCGFSQNPDDANYCGKCGKNINSYYRWKLYDYAHNTVVPDYKLSEYKRYEEKVKSSIFYNFSEWCANLWDKFKEWWQDDGIAILLCFVIPTLIFCLILFIGKSCNRDEQSSLLSATSAQITNGELNFNGAKYVGECKNGQPHGKGVMTYDNGDKYDGDWKNGQRTGKGVYYYANGEKYEGDVENGLKAGKGVMTWNNGDKYDGDWENGQPHGKGVVTWNNGDKYDGDWKNGQRSGKGVYYYANGNKYDGEWKGNKKNGKGVFYYTNGNKFEGYWKDDKRVN